MVFLCDSLTALMISETCPVSSEILCDFINFTRCVSLARMP